MKLQELKTMPAEFGDLIEAWEHLLALSPHANIFLTPYWQQLNWEAFPGQNKLYLLSLFDGQSLMGIAPLKGEGTMLSFIGSTAVSDYLDFLVLPNHEENFFEALLDYLEDIPWRIMDLRCLPASSPTLEYLPEAARKRGYLVKTEVEEVCPQISLDSTWEGFLSSLNRKNRHELRRKLRRLEEKSDVRYYTVSQAMDLPEGIKDFTRLHRLSHMNKARFMNHTMEDFFRAFLTEFVRKDWAKLYFLEVDGERVATTLCFDYRDDFMLYNSGYDPAYASLSVGLALKAYCIQEAIAQGKKTFDFLRGSEAYKYHLGAREVPIFRCVIERP